MNEELSSAYRPETFRQQGHALIDMLADQMAASYGAEQDRTIPWQSPEESFRFWNQFADTNPKLTELLGEVIRRSIRISDPRFIGHQICTPAPDTILASLVADFANNGNGVFEMGIAGVAMEKHVLDVIAHQMGMEKTAGGVMTSGGTLGNLTALLCARSIKAPEDVWRHGQSGRLALMVSEQAHYCIERAVGIMGWGTEGIIRVPTNDRFQMRVDQMPGLLDDARRAGKQVIAVVGSACTTSTGSFDDLTAIAQFCKANDLWFHVDAAHGGALAFSPTFRHRLAGIELADSVVIDFHKMLMTPVLASAVIMRRAEDGFQTFRQQADYLFEQAEDLNWHDLAQRTFECTKSMMALKIYTLLAVRGSELLAANVDQLMQTTQKLVSLIDPRPDLELAVRPDCNIVCFRYTGCSPDQRCKINAEIRKRMIESGEYYIVQTKLHDETWLRCTVTNPMTTANELSGMLDQVELLAKTLSRV